MNSIERIRAAIELREPDRVPAEAHWFGCSYLITSVEKGVATITNSFELTGGDENDKKFLDEKTEIV